MGYTYTVMFVVINLALKINWKHYKKNGGYTYERIKFTETSQVNIVMFT